MAAFAARCTGSLTAAYPDNATRGTIPTMNFFSAFLKDILDLIYSLIGNYGWSVIIFTLLIRLVIFPLDFKSRKSMRAMTKLQPKMNELQKKYGQDKEKYNLKLQELYKKEKISPLSGCLPMLISLPILFCMFTAMRVAANEFTVQMLVDWAAAVEAGVEYEPVLQGWLWIKNVFQPDSFGSTILPAFNSTLAGITTVGGSEVLTAENIEIARNFLASDAYRDICIAYGSGNFLNIPLNLLLFRFTLRIPTSFAALMNSANGLFLLPLLAGLSQMLMTKTTGQPEQKDVDPQVQAQQNPMGGAFMKWFFPIFSIWICATSNAAFSLYWMAVNVLSIIQNIAINKYLDYKDKQAELAAAQNAED